MSHEPRDPITDALLDPEAQFPHLRVDTDVSEEGEPDWLVLARDCLGLGLNTGAPQPAREPLYTEE